MDDEELLDFEPSDEDLEDEEELPSTTYAIDFENNRIVGKIDGIEAMKQAIIKAVLTPRFKCLIYSDEYGSEIKEELSENNFDREFVESVIPQYVSESLENDDRVLSVGDFDINFNESVVDVAFIASTVYGDITIDFEEVL